LIGYTLDCTQDGWITCRGGNDRYEGLLTHSFYALRPAQLRAGKPGMDYQRTYTDRTPAIRRASSRVSSLAAMSTLPPKQTLELSRGMSLCAKSGHRSSIAHRQSRVARVIRKDIKIGLRSDWIRISAEAPSKLLQDPKIKPRVNTIYKSSVALVAVAA
jgi:hypothetical protein